MAYNEIMAEVADLPRRDITFCYERAREYGRKMGLGSEADDFAGWLALQWLDNKSTHQYIADSFIDYLRGSRGRPNMASSRLKWDKAQELKKKHLEAQKPEQEAACLVEELADSLEREARIIFILKVVWGLTLAEIGHVFGITEAAASLKYTAIKKKIKKR